MDVFESHRAMLTALGYRMLGDLGRAEDMVQEAWVRWQARRVDVDSPRAYLVTMVTRLCLNELGSAKNRLELSRSDRLPEPVSLDDSALGHIENLEQVSMALMVVLQRLKPADRAVLLLHDVFDFGHSDIAGLVGKSEAACRKTLERAREHIAEEKRFFAAPTEMHQKLLAAFFRAATDGDVDGLVGLLAADALMITDGGPDGRRGRGLRNLPIPLHGAHNIAAFVVATARDSNLRVESRTLNGQPAMVLYDQTQPSAALLLGVADERIHRVFFHADLTRLSHVD